MSRRYAQRLLKELEDEGHIKIIHRFDEQKSVNKSNKYQVVVNKKTLTLDIGSEQETPTRSEQETSTVVNRRPPDPSLRTVNIEPSVSADAPPAWASLELPDVLKLPEIALYRKIAGRIPGRAQWGFIYDAIQQIGLDENKLEPFWRAHITRGGKTEALYWLTEWAVSGKISNGTRSNGAGASKHARSQIALLEAISELEGDNGAN